MHRSTSAFRTTIAAAALAAIAGCAAPAAAQSPYVGLRAGGSLSTFGGSAVAGLDSHRGGLVAGALVGWKIGERLALESELTWVQKGAEGTLQGFEEPIATDLEIDYLQVPLLVRLALPSPVGVRPVLLAGGAVAFRVGCSVETAASELALAYDCTNSDSPERLAETDWSVLVGAGLEYDAGAASLSIEGRYDRSLVENGDVTGIENRAFVVALGVRLPLGG